MMTVAMTEMSKEMEALKAKLKSTWMMGDYDRFASYMEADAKVFYQGLGIAPGTRLLDVGCGAGQLALIAARAGAVATGCDISTNWLEKARERAMVEGLAVRFEEGDVEALPYDDGQFDVVTSMFGAMFAPRPELAAAEMTRVCRPGGKIVMANWTAAGFIGKMFRVIARHIAPAGMPSPVLWGDEEVLRERFQAGIASLRVTPLTYHFRYPYPPADVVEFFRVNYGPTQRAFAALDAAGQSALRAELAELWEGANMTDHGRTHVEAGYVEVIATRG